jgi:Fe-Mn family superoxide dismutase
MYKNVLGGFFMFKPIELPYPMNALEPYYSQETLNIHYNLYIGYVDNLNKVEDKLKMAREKNNYENIKCLEKDLSFYGSGMILHQLFFSNMKPPTPGGPEGRLLGQINRDFGDFINFKNQFNEAAKVVEASGWCLLVWVPMMNKLEVLQCEKHQNLTLWGCKPLLVLDMWEHSYFLQYKSSRPNYINAFWNIINWNMVNRRFENLI